GVNELFIKIIKAVEAKTSITFGNYNALFFGDGLGEASTTKSQIIPPKRVRYLSEIVDANKNYDAWVNEQCVIASKLYQINGVLLEK
ncbi:hypothetical protein ABTA44_19915, partial [Acinetobacter baumannii]